MKTSTIFNPDETSEEKLLKYFEIPSLTSLDYELEDPWHNIPYHYCKKHLILPLKREGEFCHLAMADPFNVDLEDELSVILKSPLIVFHCPKEILLPLIERCFHQQDETASEYIRDLSKDSQLEELEQESYDLLDDQKESAPSIRLLNFIIQEAYHQRSSDIHFEPTEDCLRVRYRIDGVLQNRHTLPPSHQSHLMTRLKVMSKLDIAENRRPQDGRIKLKLGNKELHFRVSTIPIANGERIVLRILDNESARLKFDQLGMDASIENTFAQMIRRSEGILLVTGPTGSGKTTTLYSVISEIYSDSINIMTIEDPIEYRLGNIAQIGVHPKIGLTFAQGLRHILRQDPDVIMIGEIRDLETAQIAIQSSLTGHLVLSTLHTNDAPSAITRLVDMGIEPYLLSSSIIGVLAQRLVRLICPYCKEKEHPSSYDLNLIGLKDPDFSFYKGKGCSKCFHTGYRGRKGIYELMSMSRLLKQKMTHSIESNELRNIALQEGFVTLKEQGIQLIQRGETSIEEVLRVALGLQDS